MLVVGRWRSQRWIYRIINTVRKFDWIFISSESEEKVGWTRKHSSPKRSRLIFCPNEIGTLYHIEFTVVILLFNSGSYRRVYL